MPQLWGATGTGRAIVARRASPKIGIQGQRQSKKGLATSQQLCKTTCTYVCAYIQLRVNMLAFLGRVLYIMKAWRVKSRSKAQNGSKGKKLHTYPYAYIHTHIYACIYVYVCTCNIHMHICIHAHTHFAKSWPCYRKATLQVNIQVGKCNPMSPRRRA